MVLLVFVYSFVCELRHFFSLDLLVASMPVLSQIKQDLIIFNGCSFVVES